jgi:hypothetical protein
VKDLLNNCRTKHLAVIARRITACLKVWREDVERRSRQADLGDDVGDVRDDFRDGLGSTGVGQLIDVWNRNWKIDGT